MEEPVKTGEKKPKVPELAEVRALANLTLKMRELLLLVAPRFCEGSLAAAIVADADNSLGRLVEIANLETEDGEQKA